MFTFITPIMHLPFIEIGVKVKLTEINQSQLFRLDLEGQYILKK